MNVGSVRMRARVAAMLCAACALWAPGASRGAAMAPSASLATPEAPAISHAIDGLPVAGDASPLLARESASREFMRPPRVRRTALDELTADGRPTPAAIALLRSHTRGREVRLWLDGTAIVGRDARFDSFGVTVGEHGAIAAGDSMDVGHLPIPWARIGGLETRHSNLVLGAVLGTFLGGIGGGMLASAAGSDPGPGILIVLVVPPVGALIGGLVGASIPRWRHEWPPAGPAPSADR